MIHVSVIIPHGQVNVANIEGTHQLFSHANGIMKKKGKSAMFDIHIVGLPGTPVQSNLRYIVTPDELIDEVKKTDLIVIPAVSGSQQDVIAWNKDLFPWINIHHQQGAEVASFCVGAFLLAATGLLTNKQCSTHWFAADSLRGMFPDLIVVDDRIVTEDKGIYTSGGALCYLNLLVYLIEKFAGREVAVEIAKNYMIDINRASQSPFTIFDSQKVHRDILIDQAQDYIEANLSEKLTIEQLAEHLSTGRRTLERRFKKATGNSIAGYIQRVKIEAAKKHFEASDMNLNEVMYSIGYTDRKGFRSLFKRITGLSPLLYRDKYNKQPGIKLQ
jgi:transcriptional regulator GlxA family with amidase domain